jgi:predicted O-methyltransferase YrrM
MPSLGLHIFQKYKKDIEHFVETGTFMGGSMDPAREAGFKSITTVEIMERLASRAQRDYGHDPRIKVVCGNTATCLKSLIDQNQQRMFFWLDAHDVGSFPLLEELAQIGQHVRNDHTILIDDMRCAGTDAFNNLSKADIEAAVRAINPDYNITYEVNADGVPDILVAQVVSPTKKEE